MKTEYEQLGPNGVQRKTWSVSAKRNLKKGENNNSKLHKMNCKGPEKTYMGRPERIRNEYGKHRRRKKKWPKRKPTGLAQEQRTEKTGE